MTGELVFLTTRRGVLHRGTQDERNGEIQLFPGDNFDATNEGVTIYQNEMEARRAARDLCRRCFPGDRLRK